MTCSPDDEVVLLNEFLQLLVAPAHVQQDGSGVGEAGREAINLRLNLRRCRQFNDQLHWDST